MITTFILSGTAQYTCTNDTLSGLSGCTANSCNISNVTNSQTHNTAVSCDTGYGIVDNTTAYAYCPTNGGSGTLRTAPDGGGSEVSCQLKFYQAWAGEFNEGSSPIFYSNGNYNMRYLTVEYGRWWDCFLLGTGTCWKTYNKDNTSMTSVGITQWTLNVGNVICGDPKSGCNKKAKVWIGYCISGYCLE